MAASVMCGCTSGLLEQKTPDWSVDEQAIIEGTPSGANADAVVFVQNNQLRSGCTGTLVAPNLVLTARHCVAETDASAACDARGVAHAGGRVLRDSPAASMQILTGRTSATLRARSVGSQVIVHPEGTYCDRDVAFIVLASPITDITPMPIRVTQPALGERITSVGWGLTEAGSPSTSRLMRSGVAVETLGPAFGVGPREFEVGESICSGDSGGPAITVSGAVVGVVSRGGGGAGVGGAGRCVGASATNTYGGMNGREDLINRAFAAAGRSPNIEGGAAPVVPPGPTTTPVIVESAHPYANNVTQNFVVNRPAGASRFNVHFTRIETEAQYDFVTVLDANGAVVSRFDGTLADVTTPAILTATATIRLTSDASVTGFGFVVDRLNAETAAPPVGVWRPATLALETAHPYANNVSQSWRLQAPAGATQMRIHFTRFDTEARFDTLTVQDSTGGTVVTYTGALGEVTTPAIRGASATLNFVSDGSVTSFGFAIDRIDFQ